MTRLFRLSHITLKTFIQKLQLPGHLQLLLFIVHKISVSSAGTGYLHIFHQSVLASAGIISYVVHTSTTADSSGRAA